MLTLILYMSQWQSYWPFFSTCHGDNHVDPSSLHVMMTIKLTLLPYMSWWQSSWPFFSTCHGDNHVYPSSLHVMVTITLTFLVFWQCDNHEYYACTWINCWSFHGVLLLHCFFCISVLFIKMYSSCLVVKQSWQQCQYWHFRLYCENKKIRW